MSENETSGKKSSFRLKDADGKVVDNSGNSGFGLAEAGTDNYNMSDSADNYGMGGSTGNYSMDDDTTHYNISGEQSYNTGTNGGVQSFPQETRDNEPSAKTRQKPPMAVIVLVVLSNLVFLWVAFMAGKQTSFVKKHQNEYTQCQGETSNVTSEQETRVTKKTVNGKSRTVTEVSYLFTFDITYIYQDKEYMRQCRLHEDNEDAIKNGDIMYFIIRDGAVSRSFSEEYDWLWGTVESNIDNPQNGLIFIVICLVFIDLIIAVTLTQKR